jgi:hypothetical protein
VGHQDRRRARRKDHRVPGGLYVVCLNHRTSAGIIISRRLTHEVSDTGFFGGCHTCSPTNNLQRFLQHNKVMKGQCITWYRIENTCGGDGLLDADGHFPSLFFFDV